MNMTEPSNSPTVPRENRLTRYCAAGLGAAVLAGAVTTADASIVFVNYGGQVVTDSAPGDGYFSLTPFDLNGDGVVDFQLGIASGEANGGAAAIFPGVTGGTLGVVGISSSGFVYPSKLAAGANIGPTAGFATVSGRGSLAFGAGYPGSKWLTSTPGYLGLRFTVGSQTDYAWLRLSVAAASTGPNARAITLDSAAYETSGGAITAGAVPEPSTVSLGALALGAVGLAAYRRKRAAAESETLAV